MSEPVPAGANDSLEALEPIPAMVVAAPPQNVHTSSLAEILHEFGSSLAVTTYQANNLLLLRADNRDGTPKLNTHFRTFPGPMGFAWEPGRFALGTTNEIWEFHDKPELAGQLDAGTEGIPSDAAFIPRRCHVTGDILVHEMAWLPRRRTEDYSNADSPTELWFINTRFSCLCTRSDRGSFVPRWKPSFISAITPEDRCHLNSMCVKDGEICYVTSLGTADTQAGWRANKRAGGVLTDVRSGEIITRGLSMPHSPRWYGGKLWLLESGNGGIGLVDERTGVYQEVCRLPGFSRGLDFIGPYAFVGISQVRETAVFSGIAVAETPEENRCCGIWVVDTRSGQIAGSLKFLDTIQEIFAVQTLAGIRWPHVVGEDEKAIKLKRRYNSGTL